MDVVATNIHHQHLGPVVPVDEDDHRLRPPQPPRPRQASKLKPPSSTVSATSPVLSVSDHKLISDEHHILTTPGGQLAAQRAAMAPKPKFSNLMNEYVGACFEDNCNIGEPLVLRISTSVILRTFYG